MHAKDVMTVNVISVAQDSPMHEVVGLLLKYQDDIAKLQGSEAARLLERVRPDARAVP